MALLFEIISVSTIYNRDQYIFARYLDGAVNFKIKKGATLGGIPIHNYLEIPRVTDEQSEPRLDVFVFKPMQPIPPDNFVIGQVVELI